jgi:hypothetical protein
MKAVRLSNSLKYAYVSLEDYESIRLYKWYADTLDGILCAKAQVNGQWKWMHNIIAKPDYGYKVIHGNGNGLDNRQENLQTIKF